MTTSHKAEALTALAELSEAMPEVRLGPLNANLSYQARGLANESIREMEDEELLAAARQQLQEYKARHGALV